MNDEELSDVVHNIFTICNVKVRSPVMTQDLKEYITKLKNDIKDGQYD
jgi:hypothetical protein